MDTQSKWSEDTGRHTPENIGITNETDTKNDGQCPNTFDSRDTPETVVEEAENNSEHRTDSSLSEGKPDPVTTADAAVSDGNATSKEKAEDQTNLSKNDDDEIIKISNTKSTDSPTQSEERTERVLSTDVILETGTEEEKRNFVMEGTEGTEETEETEGVEDTEHTKEITTKANNGNGRRAMKRKNVSANESDNVSVEEHELRSKRKKTRNSSDRFCWRCHKESVDAHCSACPRSWHRRCIGGAQPSPQNWICGECATILRAENAETRSTVMADVSVDQLCMLLKHVIERMRDYPGSEPFWKPVDVTDAPNYFDYVIKPMDLNLLESNVRAKLYGSTDAFMADAKWIQHNCIVFNTCGGVYTDTSKLTNAAKQIIKVARQEVSEIEACPDCYAHGRNLPRPQPSWFIEPCRRPHPLVWAKLKGFPFWPAKAMPRVNSQGFVDVRFFGEHDRAWVSPKDMYLYSEDPPTPLPRKKKVDMDECVREITRHCRKLELVFGRFKFAPPKVQYDPNDPTQIKLMLPNYDPLHPMNYVSPQISPLKKKAIVRKRSQTPAKTKSLNDSPINPTEIMEIMEIMEIADSTDNTAATSEFEKTKTKTKTNVVPDEEVKEENAKDDATERKDAGRSVEKDTRNPVGSVKEENVQDEGNPGQIASGFSGGTPLAVSIKSEDPSGSEPMPKQETDSETGLETNLETVSGKNSRSNKPQQERMHNKKEISREKSKSRSPNSSLVQGRVEGVTVSQTVSQTVPHLQRRSTARNAVGKNTNPNMTKGGKSVKNVGKVYKPKTRMVDKLNAEKALRAVTEMRDDKFESANEIAAVVSPQQRIHQSPAKSGKASTAYNAASILPPSVSSVTSVSPISPGKAQQSAGTNATDQSVALFFVVNNDGNTPSKGKAYTSPKTNQAFRTKAQEQPHKDNQTVYPQQAQKKESKAKKSFSKSANNKQPPQTASRPLTSSSIDVPDFPPEIEKRVGNLSSYKMLPPEAGPLSARIYKGAHELANRMAQLMEDAYKEAVEGTQDRDDNEPDNHRATVHFLRLQIERMQWQHQQQLAELKHNTDRTMREMKASLQAEKLRAVEETRREAEEEKARCVEETKQKQWCANCGHEALFYCCWNTAYCDYPCQQSHWPTHMKTCAQQPSFGTGVVGSSSSMNAQQQQQPQQQQHHHHQVMPRLVINAAHPTKANSWRG